MKTQIKLEIIDELKLNSITIVQKEIDTFIKTNNLSQNKMFDSVSKNTSTILDAKKEISEIKNDLKT